MTEQQPTGTSADVRWPESFSRWGAVPKGPHGLASRTQLANADLPRQAGGPVRSYVKCHDWRGRRAEVELYSVAESTPTNASAAVLAAAAARRITVVRVCSDCGAHCEQPLAKHGNGQHLCPMCARIAAVRATQAQLREARKERGAWAAQALAEPHMVIVWVTATEALLTAGGHKRPPLAARLHAVDNRGRRLLDVLIRLAGPRTEGAPAEAVPACDAAPAIQEALSGRRILTWDTDVLREVLERLHALGQPVTLEGAPKTGQLPAHRQSYQTRFESLHPIVQAWRAVLDPATGNLRDCWEPGSADRLHFVLKQIAEQTGDVELPATA